MPDKPNSPYATPALTEIAGTLLDRVIRIVPEPKPKTEKPKK